MNKRHSIIYILTIAIVIFVLFPVRALAGTGDVKKVRVGYFYDEFLHQGQSDDEMKAGYGYEYYQEISNYTGWEYEYVYGSWSEIYDSFQSGEIDIIDNVFMTDERKEEMDFSSLPMGEENFYIYVPQDSEAIDMADITSLNGKKIGVVKGNVDKTLLDNFKDENDLNISVVLCESIEDCMSKASDGELDGMVIPDGFIMDSYRPTYKIGVSDYFFGVNKDRTDLLDELNASMAKIFERNANYNNQLREKYYRKTVVSSHFDAEESQYLSEHDVIRVGYRNNTLPLCKKDEKSGQVTGLLADILSEFESQTGSRFEAVVFDDNQMMVDALKNGDIDCAFPVTDSIWFSEQEGYTQTRAIAQDKMRLVFTGEYQGVDAYKTVGYTEGSPAQYVYIKQYGPGKEAVAYKTVQKNLEAVYTGDIDCAVINGNAWDYIRQMYPKYKPLNTVLLEENVGYSFAVARGNSVLYSVIESCIIHTDSVMISESVNRNSQFPSDYSIRKFLENHPVFFCVIFAVFMILIIVFALIYQKNMIEQKAIEFKAEHDLLTGVYNRVGFEKIIKKENFADKPLCLGIVDIDKFKDINDTYGHETGDEILKKVSGILASEVRGDDIVVRYGGDEFLILIFGLNTSNAEIVKNKLDRIVAKVGKSDGKLPAITISAGLAFSEKGFNEGVFTRADQALYDRKANGRNGYTINI